MITVIETEIFFETYTAELDVGIALAEAYCKQLTMEQYMEYHVEPYQEGKVGEAISGAYDKFNNWVQPKDGESMFKKILMFVPRMLNKLIQFVIGKIKTGKIDKISKNMSSCLNEADNLEALFDDEDFNFDDDDFTQDSFIDTTLADVYEEAFGQQVARKSLFGNNNVSKQQLAAQQAMIQKKKEAMLRAGAKQIKNTNQSEAALKAEAIKSVKELAAIMDRDKALFTSMTQLFMKCKTTFNPATLNDVEKMTDQIVKLIEQNPDLVIKAADAAGNAANKLANKVDANITRMNMRDTAAMNERQRAQYLHHCEQLSKNFDEFFEQLYEWEKAAFPEMINIFTNIDADLKVAGLLDEYDSLKENASNKEMVKALIIVVRDTMTEISKLVASAMLDTKGFEKKAYQMFNIIGKYSDEQLKMLEGGIEYQSATMDMLKTVLKCTKMFGACMRKLEENPDLTRLLNISLILLRVAKMIVI